MGLKTKIKITFFSDIHGKSFHLDPYDFKKDADLVIFSGDIMTKGYNYAELKEFLYILDSLNYPNTVFIAGNHDKRLETKPVDSTVDILLNDHPFIDYLEDSEKIINLDSTNKVKIYGSPWQPEFGGWAFNLPRNGKELESKWKNIPDDTDILVTHSPPFGILDVPGWPHKSQNLGCELLRQRVEVVKPKIHVFGHIHGSYGYKFLNGTHFINACLLDESYELVRKPIHCELDILTNELKFI